MTQNHTSVWERRRLTLTPFDWARYWGVEASPGFILLDPKGELLTSVVGYFDLARFEMVLNGMSTRIEKEGRFLIENHTDGNGSIKGIVMANGEALPFANVAVLGTTIGAATDSSGAFKINNVRTGSYRLAAAAVGFKTAEIDIEVASNRVEEATIVLEEVVHEMDGIVVTGTLAEAFIKDSPVKVDVVSSSYLETIPTTNVMEVLENINGLYQQIDCGVCGTNNIRINGMDGPYTAVLIDGTPIMSSLATVYGLNGISPSLLQQVEIIKGPMSTMYGSEAMGGVINIITKNPQSAPRMAVNSLGSSDGEYALDIGIVPSRGRINSILSGTLLFNARFHDKNGDNFADLVLTKRISVFHKIAITDKKGGPKVFLFGRYYFENRLGGTNEFIHAFTDLLRGSDKLYGETIRTHRLELVGSYYINDSSNARLDLAYNFHNQDSFYGADSYQANQTTAFAQHISPIWLNDKHSLQMGTALRIQKYDDNTGATGIFDEAGRQVANKPDNRIIPGIFTQYEYIPSAQVRVLTGIRLDHQKDHNIILSPRVSFKINSGDYTTFRFNGGTGFRIVNLFTEDHAAYTGARATVILEDLDPERSINSTVSLQQIIQMGYSPLTVDIDAFYTYFTNKIEPDYSNPGVIQYANLEGSATTKGLSFTLKQNIRRLNVSYTITL